MKHTDMGEEGVQHRDKMNEFKAGGGNNLRVEFDEMFSHQSTDVMK